MIFENYGDVLAVWGKSNAGEELMMLENENGEAIYSH